MKKTFFKSLVISFAFWQAVFITTLPLSVFAQEAEATPTPETTITTGDATSTATSESDANSADTQVPGSLTGDGCGPETTCPTDTTVSTDQEATTGASSSATSETGENEATTSGDLVIDTGDANSQGTSDSQANLNVVEVPSETPPPSSEPSPEPESAETSSSPSPTPEATLAVDTNQEATSSALSSALSETGQNMGLTEEQLQIITGAALAIATGGMLAEYLPLDDNLGIPIIAGLVASVLI